MTEQPDWECIANLGDMNPIEHGGKFVLVDKTGVYAPEMEVVEQLVQEPDTWRVWRFIMEPHTYVRGVLSDNKYHPELPVWYAKDIPDIARMFDMTAEALIHALCSPEPRERAEGYYCLWSYYPAEEFDSYPLELDRAEVEERYSESPYNVEV